jgi:hypothetical protein
MSNNQMSKVAKIMESRDYLCNLGQQLEVWGSAPAPSQKYREQVIVNSKTDKTVKKFTVLGEIVEVKTVESDGTAFMSEMVVDFKSRFSNKSMENVLENLLYVVSPSFLDGSITTKTMNIIGNNIKLSASLAVSKKIVCVDIEKEAMDPSDLQKGIFIHFFFNFR